MRKRIWLLASCGIMGVGFGLCAADAPPGHLADELSALSLTDPVSTSPAADSKNPFDNAAPAPEKPVGKAVPSGVVNADQQLFEGADPASAPRRKNPN